MRLYEYEAKAVLKDEGLVTPRQYGVFGSPAAVKQTKARFPAMVKAHAVLRKGSTRCSNGNMGIMLCSAHMQICFPSGIIILPPSMVK